MQRVFRCGASAKNGTMNDIRLCVGRRTRRAFALPSILPFRFPSPSSLLFVNTAVLLSNAAPFHCAQTAYAYYVHAPRFCALSYSDFFRTKPTNFPPILNSLSREILAIWSNIFLFIDTSRCLYVIPNLISIVFLVM